jgi:putative ABC transport system substrate-binding protein
MAGLTDPIVAGLVPSLARPGGNITGLTNIFIELSGKRLELLKEAVPRLSLVAVLGNPDHPGHRLALELSQRVAERIGVRLLSVDVRQAGDREAAFALIVRERVGGLHVLPDPLTAFHRRQIAEFARAKRLPAMYATREWPEAGGLLAYGTHWPDVWRRAAVCVDKIRFKAFCRAKPRQKAVLNSIRRGRVLGDSTRVEALLEHVCGRSHRDPIGGEPRQTRRQRHGDQLGHP